MKWIALLSVAALVGCATQRMPKVVYVTGVNPNEPADPFNSSTPPDVPGRPGRPVAVVELDDGKVVAGSIRYVHGVKMLVEQFEPRLISVGWDSIKSVTFISPTNSLPKDWHELPNAKTWKPQNNFLDHIAEPARFAPGSSEWSE